jgi:hypothetical protein
MQVLIGKPLMADSEQEKQIDFMEPAHEGNDHPPRLTWRLQVVAMLLGMMLLSHNEGRVRPSRKGWGKYRLVMV